MIYFLRCVFVCATDLTLEIVSSWVADQIVPSLFKSNLQSSKAELEVLKTYFLCIKLLLDIVKVPL